jgi:hypothetical protein
MNDQDYEKALGNTISQLADLARQRDDIEIRIGKLKQLFHATLNMLPDEKRKQFDEAFETVGKLLESNNGSLTEAIRRILQAAPTSWLTAADVRDCLVKSGFNFAFYASNPLSSVSTTLRRLKPEEMMTSQIEGVTAYRWKRKPVGFPSGKRRHLRGSFGDHKPVTEDT